MHERVREGRAFRLQFLAGPFLEAARNGYGPADEPRGENRRLPGGSAPDEKPNEGRHILRRHGVLGDKLFAGDPQVERISSQGRLEFLQILLGKDDLLDFRGRHRLPAPPRRGDADGFFLRLGTAEDIVDTLKGEILKVGETFPLGFIGSALRRDAEAGRQEVVIQAEGIERIDRSVIGSTKAIRLS